MSAEFQLDPRLQADTLSLATWPLCAVQMMNDASFPWFILVPRVPDIREVYELSPEQRRQLDRESTYLGKTLMQVYQGDKLNVAALGNVVSQLHIHHLVRYKHDSAWPVPVWGRAAPVAMTKDQIAARISEVSPFLDPDWSSMP